MPHPFFIGLGLETEFKGVLNTFLEEYSPIPETPCRDPPRWDSPLTGRTPSTPARQPCS